jgi:methylenetetrahydrofolate--tRNA-(uracil-5-)-methyltransferase
MSTVTEAGIWVVGGGLAGSEAAWQIAQAGVPVTLFEMRPVESTGAHAGSGLAELVCSNSLGSALADRASGVLIAELRHMGSLLLGCAEATRLPAGGALAVDRVGFAARVTEAVSSHPGIQVVRQRVDAIPEGVGVLASGPLTAPTLASALRDLAGEEHLYFYDALSPIVDAATIDETVAFRASRYDRGEEPAGDYFNCPMDREQYTLFVRALVAAERIPLREFEQDLRSGVRAGPDRFFEGCLPVEILAQREEQALSFGPLRPVGLTDPRTGRWPFAVVQLRQDDLAGSLYNLVGFQTNLTYPEQDRVFRMIPGLEKARFVRHGQMHRNTFVNSPKLLHPWLETRVRPGLFMAGQITGVEGYLGNIATGLLAGVNAARHVLGEPPIRLPPTTLLGALCEYVTHADPRHFQPMKAAFGLLPPLDDGRKRGRRERNRLYAERSAADMARAWPPPLRIATT